MGGVTRKRVPDVLSRCHITCAHPSFGMTTTQDIKEEDRYRSLITALTMGLDLSSMHRARLISLKTLSPWHATIKQYEHLSICLQVFQGTLKVKYVCITVQHHHLVIA